MGLVKIEAWFAPSCLARNILSSFRFYLRIQTSCSKIVDPFSGPCKGRCWIRADAKGVDCNFRKWGNSQTSWTGQTGRTGSFVTGRDEEEGDQRHRVRGEAPLEELRSSRGSYPAPIQNFSFWNSGLAWTRTPNLLRWVLWKSNRLTLKGRYWLIYFNVSLVYLRPPLTNISNVLLVS